MGAKNSKQGGRGRSPQGQSSHRYLHGDGGGSYRGDGRDPALHQMSQSFGGVAEPLQEEAEDDLGVEGAGAYPGDSRRQRKSRHSTLSATPTM